MDGGLPMLYLSGFEPGQRNKLGYLRIIDLFRYFSVKTYVVGTHLNRLIEVILMNTHNICFYGEL